MHRAFGAGLYYPALLVGLTLPEICVGLSFEGKRTRVNDGHYKDWIAEFATDGLGVDGQVCYRLRCGLVHRGDAAGHGDLGADNVIFTVPESQTGLHGFGMQMGEGPSACMLDLRLFLGAMHGAVIRWHEKHGADATVQRNVQSLLSFRPNGLPPFVMDAPVVGSGPSYD